MFERGRVTQEQEIEYGKRFDRASAYWSKARDEKRIENTEFLRQVFESEEAEIYREFCDDEFFRHVAITLNSAWNGENREVRREQ